MVVGFKLGMVVLKEEESQPSDPRAAVGLEAQQELCHRTGVTMSHACCLALKPNMHAILCNIPPRLLFTFANYCRYDSLRYCVKEYVPYWTNI
jgi:hypothetical protein